MSRPVEAQTSTRFVRATLVRPRPPVRVRPSAAKEAIERAIELLDAVEMHLVVRPDGPFVKG